MLAQGDLAFILAKVNETLDQRLPIGHEGVIANGSWVPADGTVSVILGDTVSCFQDNGDQPIVLHNVPYAVADIGDQSGPSGGERVVLLHTQSGFIAKAHHGPDDSPGAPSGERWITGKKRYKIATLGGWTLVLDDSGKAATLTSPGGLVLKLDDNAALASITGNVNIGAASGLTASANGIVRQADLQTAMANFKAAMVTAAVTNAGAIVVPTATSSATSLAK